MQIRREALSLRYRHEVRDYSAYTAVTQGSGNQCHNARKRDEVADGKDLFHRRGDGRVTGIGDIINTVYLRYTRALATV
ncbi:Uncharacterised protein [Salmonella enterica subsp. enterica]|nr:Uncharacterised protein [Salmonella enterica subsp. enterica]